MTGHPSRGSVLKKYLFTYVGIAIAVCAALGLLLIGASSAGLRQQEEDSIRDRLMSAAEDFSYQLDLMRDLSVSLKTTVNYQPHVLRVNPYYDMELLKDFRKYTGLSPVVKDYYLWYEDTDSVFTAVSKLPFSLFAQMLGTAEGPLREKLSYGVTEIGTENGNAAVCVFPIRFTSYSRNSTARLIFILDRDALRDRYSGLFRLDTLSLSADGVMLIGEEAHESLRVPMRTNGVELVFSSKGVLSASRFPRRMLVIVFAMALLFSVLSAVMAYRSYLPIRNLAARFEKPDSDTEDELALINHAIDRVLQQRQASVTALTESLEKLTSMRRMLRQQLLLLIISGDYNPALMPRLAEEGIDLSEGKFVMAHMKPCSVPEDVLTHRAERLSDADAAYLMTRLPGERGWALLIRAKDAQALETACDIAADDLALFVPDAQLHFGPVCDTPQKLAYSLAVAEGGQEDGDAQDHAGEELSRLLRLIASGEEKEALQTLDTLLQKMQKDYPSELFRRYRMTEMLYHLVQAAREAGYEVPDAWVRSTVSIADWQRFHESVGELVSLSCRAAGKREQLPASAARLIEYIREHACEEDLCLDRVSGEMDISAKQVSRVVRSASGMGFREYITQLRMEKAAQLLAEGRSSTETAPLVGFTDVSYFTKVFRSVMGCTPGQYKQSL